MKSIVELIEYNFGATLDNSLIDRLRHLDRRSESDTDTVEEFMGSLADFTDDPYIPERTEDELRAFVGYSHSDADMIFYNVDQNGVDLNYFKRLLLYYDRVALTIHTEFFYERRWDPRALTGFVELVNSMKPLVEKNIINFVNEPVLYNPTTSFKRSFKAVTGKALPAIGSHYYDSEGKREIEPAVLADLNACHAIDFDYATTLKSNWSVIKDWYVKSPKEVVEKEAQHLWANSLISFDLPNLTNLTYDDIISIRQNSDAFEEWRRSLNQLFELLAKNNPSTVDEIARRFSTFQNTAREKRDASLMKRSETRACAPI